MSELILEFLGELWEVSPDEEMTFGREGDLAIEDPSVHRCLGTFVHHDGRWWLRNVGICIELEMSDMVGEAAEALAPLMERPVPFGRFRVWFEAGEASYEISGTTADPTNCKAKCAA